MKPFSLLLVLALLAGQNLSAGTEEDKLKKATELSAKIASFYNERTAQPAVKENLQLHEKLAKIEARLKALPPKEVKLRDSLTEDQAACQKQIDANQMLIDWLDLYKKDSQALAANDYKLHAQLFEKAWDLQDNYNKLTKKPFPHPNAPFQMELEAQKKRDAAAQKKAEAKTTKDAAAAKPS